MKTRSAADQFVWYVLRIKERRSPASDAAVFKAFRRSMMISALRCTLTYVIFPFLLPMVSFAAGVGPALGIIVGVVAMTCDVYTIRRFFQADHRFRWPVSLVAFGIMSLLAVLLVQDIVNISS